MITLKHFTFGPFQENTYVLWDETLDCVIIDPGNSNANENKTLSDFISANHLKPQRLLLTHAHIDHINGNQYVYDTYKLLPEVHPNDVVFIEKHTATATMYGLSVEQSPMPKAFINEGDVITLGNTSLQTLFTPGHSPGSITFYNEDQKLLISGDVLFYGSIGRTDLPLGDHTTLINSIKQKLMVLADDVKVYSGHGPATTIGFERMNNPFLN